jgi:hypothetical protein
MDAVYFTAGDAARCAPPAPRGCSSPARARSTRSATGPLDALVLSGEDAKSSAA